MSISEINLSRKGISNTLIDWFDLCKQGATRIPYKILTTVRQSPGSDRQPDKCSPRSKNLGLREIGLYITFRNDIVGYFLLALVRS